MILTALLAVGAERGAEKVSIDLEQAARYFREARALSDADGGRLWGVPLAGPMLFVDPETRMVVASRADEEGYLRKNGAVFVGELPRDTNVANTATHWAGVHWTMLLWPLPETEASRIGLLAHEMFHRIQDGLDLPTGGAGNAHLDSYDGRVWIQMEWRALAVALATKDRDRAAAVEDALLIRAFRRSLFPPATSEENALELNEGLAEYTATRALKSAGLEHSLRLIAEAPERPTFVRSFAYISGPAYGLLLDDQSLGWRKDLASTPDLGELLRRRGRIAVPADLESTAKSRAVRYDDGGMMAAEQTRERDRLERVAGYRQRLLDDPILILPLNEGMRYSFNPNNLESIESLGTVFPTLRVVDLWGVLEVTGTALIVQEDGNMRAVHVPAPTGGEITGGVVSGDGWTLEIESGWEVEKADRIGDYRLAQR